MDITWLKDFEALFLHKNFSRAADERNVSQPAFSRRIRALEDEVGVSLINRQTLPLSLTPAGDVFLSQAAIMLRTYEETIERCQTIDAAGENIIRFATSQSLYVTHYKKHIESLVEDIGLDVNLNSTSWGAVQFVSALQQNYCDVILTYWHPAMDFLSPLEVSKCEYITLSKDEFIPVSRANGNGEPEHSFFNDQRKSVPLLSYGSTSALRFVLDHLLAQRLNTPKVLVMNQNALAISVKSMVMEGFGIGWLPRELCKDQLKNGELVIAGGDDLCAPLEVRLYRGKDNLKPSLNKLWDIFRAQAIAKS